MPAKPIGCEALCYGQDHARGQGKERYGLQEAEYETLEASLSALLQTVEEKGKMVGE